MAAVADRIEFHGIAGFLYGRVQTLQDWPATLIDRFRDVALSQSFWEAAHRTIICTVVSALDAAGVATVMLKGTAIAYSLYDDPALRRRGDTDILIRESDLARTRAVLNSTGFHRQTRYLYQESWLQTDSQGFTHCLDLHWQVLNMPVLRHVLGVEESFRTAVSLPRLMPIARASDPVSLFMHGCINQCWHEEHGIVVSDHVITGGDRLIWAMDNHLLAGRFTDGQWTELVDRACSRGIATACLAGLHLAQRNMNTPVPATVLAALGKFAADERVSGLFSTPDPMALVRANFGAVAGPRDWLAYLWIVMFPPQDHMHRKYPDAKRWPLPLLYLRRMLAAGGRLLGRGAN